VEETDPNGDEERMNGMNLQAARVSQQINQQAAAEAMVQGEIRSVANQIYVGLVTPYLADCATHGIPCSKDHSDRLREFARLANKAAIYPYVAAGIAKVQDEAAHWAK
jgi:hypothetical protein